MTAHAGGVAVMRECLPPSALGMGEDHLRALQQALAAQGIQADLRMGAWPRLRVYGTACGTSSADDDFDNSVVAISRQGGWWFAWPWAEPISPVTSLAAAIDKITDVVGGPCLVGEG